MLRFLLLLNLLGQFLAIPVINSPYASLAVNIHNCCTSCGYVYCETLLECIRPWEIECPELINPFVIIDKIIDDKYNGVN